MFSSNGHLPLLGALIGGLVAGVLDIVYAFILSGLAGRKPLGALKAVASGVLGAEAFKGGIPTAALGLVLHLGITVVAAWAYLFCARRATYIRDHYLVCGSIFGALVYLVMNFVVLPLSAVPFKLIYSPLVIVQGFVSHALLVGIPIALCVRRFSIARVQVDDA
jgi:hypothetical protein